MSPARHRTVWLLIALTLLLLAANLAHQSGIG
jgi:hypothetical protein